MMTNDRIRETADAVGWMLPPLGSTLTAERRSRASNLVAVMIIVSPRMIKIVAPKYDGFLNELRKRIPEDNRVWDDSEKAWKIREPYLTVARDLVYAWYGFVHSTHSHSEMVNRQLDEADQKVRDAEAMISRLQAEVGRLVKLLDQRPTRARVAEHSALQCLNKVRINWPDDAFLGVLPDAHKDAVDGAFRRLSMVRHPDRNKSPTAQDDFKRLFAAMSAIRVRRKWVANARPEPTPPAES